MWRNWLRRHDQTGKVVAGLLVPAVRTASLFHPAYSRQLRGATTPSAGMRELPHRHAQQWGANMPAHGREDGGGVVVKCLAVMGRTRRRSARVSRRTCMPTDMAGKADDGRHPYDLLVRLAVGNDQSARAEYYGPTGKRSAGKLACSVWSGGKAARPYTHPLNGEAALSCMMGVLTYPSPRRSRLCPAYHRSVSPCRPS
jgi:hypothetical protein